VPPPPPDIRSPRDRSYLLHVSIEHFVPSPESEVIGVTVAELRHAALLSVTVVSFNGLSRGLDCWDSRCGGPPPPPDGVIHVRLKESPSELN
jgi:hypothetical protein